jgi:hypothetical protein
MTEERRATQRAHSRRAVLMQCQAADGLHALIEADTEDLSSAAFRCLCDRPLDLFGRVEVVIYLTSGGPPVEGRLPTVQCDGVVVRQQQVRTPDGSTRHEAVVFLDHTTPEQRDAIEEAVRGELGGHQTSA